QFLRGFRPAALSVRPGGPSRRFCRRSRAVPARGEGTLAAIGTDALAIVASAACLQGCLQVPASGGGVLRRSVSNAKDNRDSSTFAMRHQVAADRLGKSYVRHL